MSTDIIRILVIEDEEFDVLRIENTLKPYSEKIQIKDVVSSGKDALECIEKNAGVYDIVIMDYQISGGLYGEALIQKIKQIDKNLQIIIITKRTINQTNLFFANQLMESGAYWFGTKYPGDIEEYIYQPTDFVLSIMNAYEKRQLELEHSLSQKQLDRNIHTLISKSPMIGESEIMLELKKLIEKYAEPNANVLILGESGTGKERVASMLHYYSNRKFENFITVNCAAIPKELIESELFGFEKGSFTGAKESKAGFFEQADGGSLFLDEVTELTMSAQAKLLRVLQEGEIDKIGRKQKHHVDVRVIAATNKDIEELLDKKEFREDLFYRLNILQIKVPPLRERHGDIQRLLDYFITFYCNDMGKIPPRLPKEAVDLLNRYSWPGNIRQLKNVVHRMVILSSDVISEDIVKNCIAVDKRRRPTGFDSNFLDDDQILPLRDMEFKFKKSYIQYVRKSCRTDAETAEKLGMAPSNYHRLCKELGLK